MWTIFVTLLILWLLGFVGFHVLGAYIHILLLIAIVVLIFPFIGGRRGGMVV
ncbi:MAG TPA: lmo0937 family membrane protein [Acidobacteriaceae bacterium]|nr:lmo0937 family membrane protein [Acidobacteriaceae bacterium]